MAYLINSAGLETSGTSGADLFQVQSAAAKASTIKGLAGSDTVTLSDGASTATSMLIDVAGGSDKLALSGGTISASTLKAGAGGDTITFSAVTFGEGVLNGGDGDDTLTRSVVISPLPRFPWWWCRLRNHFRYHLASAELSSVQEATNSTLMQPIFNQWIYGGGGADSLISLV